MEKNIVKLLKEISMGELRNTIAKTLTEKALANVAGRTMNPKKSVAAFLTAIITSVSPIIGSVKAVNPDQGIDIRDEVDFNVEQSTPAEIAAWVSGQCNVDAHDCQRPEDVISALNKARIGLSGKKVQTIIFVCPGFEFNDEYTGVAITVAGDRLPVNIALTNTKRSAVDADGYASFFYDGWKRIVKVFPESDGILFVNVGNQRTLAALLDCCYRVSPDAPARWEAKAVDTVNGSTDAMRKRDEYEKEEKEIVASWLTNKNNCVDASKCTRPEDILSELNKKARIGSSGKKVQSIVFVCPGFEFAKDVNPGVGIIVTGDRKTVNTVLTGTTLSKLDDYGYIGLSYHAWWHVLQEFPDSNGIVFVNVGNRSIMDDLYSRCCSESPDAPIKWENQALAAANGLSASAPGSTDGKSGERRRIELKIIRRRQPQKTRK